LIEIGQLVLEKKIFSNVNTCKYGDGNVWDKGFQAQWQNIQKII
jgi:hypothetical protein